MLVLVGTAVAVPSPVFVSLDQEPTDTGDLPTCAAAWRHDGTEVATTVEPIDDKPGEYRVVITPDQLGHIDLTWSGTIDSRASRMVDAVEVVGAVVATVTDVLAHPDMKTRQTTSRRRILLLISEFTDDVVRRARGYSPVPRRCRQMLSPGAVHLAWPYVSEVLGATVDGVAQTVTTPARMRPIDRTGWSHGDAVIDYVHGAADVPESLRRACAAWVAATIAAEDLGKSRDALWETTESGTIRYSSPDWERGRFTGLVAVDPVLNALPDLRGL